MKLYSNGCSYTWGGTLFNFGCQDENGERYWLPKHKNCDINKKRLETVYPYHLGKLLNASETINESMGGGSNDRIVRTTLEYFNKARANKEDLSEYFVTIQWTEPSRIEFFDSVFENTHTGFLSNNFYSENGPDEYIYHEKKHKMYFKHFHNSVDDLNRLIKNIYALGYFLRYHRIPHLFFSISQLFNHYTHDMLGQERIELLDYYNSLMKDFNWLYDANQALGTCIKFENCSPAGTHPNVEGHKQLAFGLYNYIIEKNLLQK